MNLMQYKEYLLYMKSNLLMTILFGILLVLGVWLLHIVLIRPTYRVIKKRMNQYNELAKRINELEKNMDKKCDKIEGQIHETELDIGEIRAHIDLPDNNATCTMCGKKIRQGETKHIRKRNGQSAIVCDACAAQIDYYNGMVNML